MVNISNMATDELRDRDNIIDQTSAVNSSVYSVDYDLVGMANTVTLAEKFSAFCIS